ncbi:MAG: hypothetical protein ABIE36_02425 [Candidatus Diapherotrites archaeon]
MIKDKEVAMVHAADYALEYLNKEPQASAEEIIKKFLRNFESINIKKEMKIYSVAAISEILKLKNTNKGKLKKQLIQMFVNKIPIIVGRIDEENGN